MKPKILIIGGSGRMGQWFRSFFEAHDLPVKIQGRKSKTPLSAEVQQANIVLVSVPLDAVEKTISSLLPHIKEDALLSDISSLKVSAMEAMRASRSATLGMHPLFGPSILSPVGLRIVFCHQKDNHRVTFLRQLFESSGMEVITMKPEEHDKQMAYIQALVHSINILFAQTLESAHAINSKLQTPLFSLQSLVMQRVLQQEPELMADIQLLNPHFLKVLEELHLKTESLLEKNKDIDRTALLIELEKLRSRHAPGAGSALRQTNKILQMLQDKPASTRIDPSNEPINNSTIKVAYLGPEGTNTHQAATDIFGNNAKTSAQSTLDDVFMSVTLGKADVGVVPAENTIHGTVRETLDLLSDSDLFVVGSYDLPIHHSLLSNEIDLKKIKKVISHPQALAQCKEWLTEHLPRAVRETAPSTTSSLAHPKPGEAYISSDKASKLYNIPVLSEAIEDRKNNTTRFFVITRKSMSIPNLNTSNTLLFLSIYNRVGILRDILNVFADEGISLNKLESRPSQEKIWDYYFYIEVDVAASSEKLKLALEKLQPFCPVIKVLGGI